MRFVGRSIFMLVIAATLLSGCSTPEMAYNSEPVTPDESEIAYSVSVSAPPVQINGGNLHWHKKLPNNTYILEDLALEIHNFGDFDIRVTQLEVSVDGNSQLLNIDMTIPGKTSKSLVVQPMSEGHNGGTHIVSLTLLDEDGNVLCESGGYEVGPLEPVPGTGSWQQALDY